MLAGKISDDSRMIYDLLQVLDAIRHLNWQKNLMHNDEHFNDLTDGTHT